VTTPKPAPAGYTDFSKYSHQQLYQMLHAGNQGTARSAAVAWDSTGGALHEQAGKLEGQLASFSQGWQGGAADQYKSMMTDLVGGIRKVADAAFAMRNLSHDSADALETAKAQMPPPVNVPDVPPATVSMATTPIQVDGSTSPAQVAMMQQQQAAAVAAVQEQRQASAAANAAHAKAISVMRTLAGDYVTAEQAIPPSPNAATPPKVPGQPGPGEVTIQPIDAPGLGETPGQTGKPASPLFGNMFTAGLAAASAAAFGRFGLHMPRVPGWAGKNKDKNGKPGTEGTGKLGEKFGGGGASGGGGGIGGGGAGQGPSASASMLGGGGPTGDFTSGMHGVGGGAAAGAATGMGRGMGMMPFMPMGAGMGGDMGAGRRIPPWLVETENVWGESSVVAPTVIGEETDPGSDSTGRF
jgi:uncharacterized protein YukE